MKLHSVVISYFRKELTQQAIDSYLETVTVPYTLMVVDNGSDPETTDWLDELRLSRTLDDLILLGENRYPGYACNRGFTRAPDDATYLHRIDNDFRFLPGWCEAVEVEFHLPEIGQVGLRTDEEELYATSNVGGNMVLRRTLWNAGLRYDEKPWPEYPPGYSEDSFFSPRVREMGYLWTRVRTPCIVSLASGDWRDPYYQKSYGDRRITPGPNDPTATGIY